MKSYPLREAYLKLGIFCFMGTLILRIAYLQIIEHEFFKTKSTIQLKKLIKLYPHRGFIFDRIMIPLALTQSSYAAFLVPDKLDHPEEIVQTISSILNLDNQDILQKVQTTKGSFLWLKRQLSKSEYTQLKEKNLKHIGFIKTEKRVYPKGNFASHVLGFVGIDNQGLGGLEHKFDSFLRGTPGKVILEKDPNGYPLLSGEKVAFPPYDGNHLVTTLDEFIQYISQKYLEEAISENNAEKGQIIVMNPQNGDILAMAAYPNFDPNNEETISKKNPCISDVYEPGSVFKLITFAIALEHEVITPKTILQIPEELQLKNVIISEAHKRSKGESDMKTSSEILEQSLNVGTSLISIKLGEEKLYEGIKAFKIGDLTGIELPAESKGLVRPLKNWSGVDIAMISFGQGIAVTPIQMISAVAAIANNGIYVKPRILQYMTNANFETLKAIPISKIRLNFKEKTMSQLKEMMKNVVEKGTGVPAKLEGYSIAGKTGTSQKPRINGLGYEAGKYVASFVGFFPVEKPRYVILVIIDSPKKSIYGSTVAAPVFRKITKDIIQYFHIPPKNSEK